MYQTYDQVPVPVVVLISAWGGESFMFFRPVFNIADASISGGVFAILIFQSRFFPSVEASKAPTEETETPTV